MDHKLPPNIEALHNNFNYKKSKWLLSGLYHPQVSLISISFIKRKMGLDIYSKYYQKKLLVGAFNAEESEPFQSQFLFEVNVKNIVKKLSFCLTSKKKSNAQCIEIYSLSKTVEISNGKFEQEPDINLIKKIFLNQHLLALCQVKQMTISKKLINLITKLMYIPTH